MSVGLVCGSKVFTLRWVGVGWVEEIGTADNSELALSERKTLDHLESVKENKTLDGRSLSWSRSTRCHVTLKRFAHNKAN